MTHKVQPEGEEWHIIAYGVIIHAEYVAVLPRTQAGKRRVIADLLLGENGQKFNSWAANSHKRQV